MPRFIEKLAKKLFSCDSNENKDENVPQNLKEAIEESLDELINFEKYNSNTQKNIEDMFESIKKVDNLKTKEALLLDLKKLTHCFRKNLELFKNHLERLRGLLETK